MFLLLNPGLFFYSPSGYMPPMVQPNPSGNVVLTQPEVFMEMVALLAQNPALLSALQPSLSALQPPSLPIESTLIPSSTPPLPSQGCSFSHPNCGMGGVLMEKQKVSKEITASATKCKSPLDPDVETMSEIAESNSRQTKRSKAIKVCCFCISNHC